MSDTLQLILEKLTAIEEQQKAIQLEQKVLYRQMEALFALYQQFDFKAPLLNMRSWVASPDLLAVYSALMQEYKPTTIFEAGGGTSTIISAYNLQQLGRGHVYAVDHQEQFAELANHQLKLHGLSDFGTVIHAPLVEVNVNGATWQWYDMDRLASITNIDLMLVDGPPQYANTSDMARYPALPLMQSKLTANAHILVDDADREEEFNMCQRWEAEFPLELLRYYEKSWADIEKGARHYRYTSET